MPDVAEEPTGDMDPATAARFAQAEDEEVAQSMTQPDPTADLGPDLGNIQEMLMSTEPSQPLEMVESPWNPGLGGPRRIMRGIQKMTNADGLPAGADLLIGVLETYTDMAESKGNDDSGGIPEGNGPAEHDPGGSIA